MWLNIYGRKYREAEGFLLVYSITKRATFDEVIALYQRIIRVKENEELRIVLAGNKCDLEDQRQVTTEEGQKLAESWDNVRFFETSAKTKINNKECFYEVARLIRDSQKHIIIPQNNSNKCCNIL